MKHKSKDLKLRAIFYITINQKVKLKLQKSLVVRQEH